MLRVAPLVAASRLMAHGAGCTAPALLSPARMRWHAAPRAIKLPQHVGHGRPPLLSVIDRAIREGDTSAPTSAPDSGAGGDMQLPWQWRCWAVQEGHGGRLAAMLVGPSGGASCPPIDLPGLSSIDHSNLQEFIVSMRGWLTFCARAVQYRLVTAFND